MSLILTLSTCSACAKGYSYEVIVYVVYIPAYTILDIIFKVSV